MIFFFSEVSDPRSVFHRRLPGPSQGSHVPVWRNWPGLWASALNCLAFVCLGRLIQVRACYLCQSAAVGFFLMIQIYYLPAASLPWKLCTGREPLAVELGDGLGTEYNSGSPAQGLSVVHEG